MNFAKNQSLKIFLTSFIILLIGIIIIYSYNYSSITKNHLKLADDMVSEISVSIEYHILEKVKTVKTIAIAPVILKALQVSNEHYSRLSEQKRDEKIQSKNIKWKSISDQNNQFILEYTDNAVSQYLKIQQDNIKDEYGEIFITDKYGAIIATTAKLTTYAHGHKYWWKGAYNNGDGAVFFDDRGYDDSVGGYVLGVVVPIKNGNEIIGILKANLNILGSIDEMLLNVKKDKKEQLFLMRSDGLIVYKEGLEPLSKRVPDRLLEKLLINENSFIFKEEGLEGIYSRSEIGITAGKQGYRFGGSFESIDHEKGNTNESWYMVDFYPISHLTKPVNKNLRIFLLIGLILSFVLAITSLIIGNQAAKPIKELIKQTLKISEGDYNSKVFTKRADEIGQLSLSFNKMTRNLKETTTSLDNLNLEIADRKQAEDELRINNERHSAMIENIGDVIAIMGVDGMTKYQSPNIEKYFGWKPEDMFVRNAWDNVHPEDIERIQKEFGEMLKKETASIVEFRFKCKDGNYKWIEMTALNSINDPAINGMLFNYHDITERKQAEESLKESEEKYRSIFESFQDIYYRANNRGIITELSPSVLQISGYKPDELIGKPVAVVYQDSANRLNLLQALKESGRVADYELKLLTKDKKVKIGSICSHVIIGQDGEINGIEGVIRDITERKQAEQELKISRERLKTANSILRHDITNDLTVIKSAVDIYRDERDETMIDEIEKRVKKSIETIHNQKDQMAFLDTHADLDEYDVKQVVQDVIKNYPDLEFKITGSGNAYADNALYSVFDNIISNAVRHGKTTQLDIDIIPGKEHCEIRFKDYGTGVPDEIKDKIFDEGYHYGKTGHTGIGLYIVQQTVEEYGGEVTVEDNKPHGAIFIIRMKKMIEG